MTLRGRPLSTTASERKPFMVYVVPKTHLLARLIAEHRATTIGRLFDELIAAEAERDGISLGRAS